LDIAKSESLLKRIASITRTNPAVSQDDRLRELARKARREPLLLSEDDVRELADAVLRLLPDQK
jgi:hypothetical protein